MRKAPRPSIAECVKALVDSGANVEDIVIDRANDKVFVDTAKGATTETGAKRDWTLVKSIG